MIAKRLDYAYLSCMKIVRRMTVIVQIIFELESPTNASMLDQLRPAIEANKTKPTDDLTSTEDDPGPSNDITVYRSPFTHDQA